MAATLLRIQFGSHIDHQRLKIGLLQSHLLAAKQDPAFLTTIRYSARRLEPYRWAPILADVLVPIRRRVITPYVPSVGGSLLPDHQPRRAASFLFLLSIFSFVSFLLHITASASTHQQVQLVSRSSSNNHPNPPHPPTKSIPSSKNAIQNPPHRCHLGYRHGSG